MRGYYHVGYVLFVCGFTYNSRSINSYGDVEGRVNIIDLLKKHKGILEMKNMGHADFIILGLKTG